MATLKILGQRDSIAKKPEPSGVHEILSDLGQSSSNTILIRDSTIDSITARNTASIHSLAVTWGYHDKDNLSALTSKHLLACR